MKPFQFSLQAVAAVRENEETRAGEAYARAVRLRREVAIKQQEIENGIQENLVECGQVFGQGVHAEKVVQIHATLRVLRARLKEFSTEADRLQAAVDEKWRQLVLARQRREVVGKLHDRQLAAHQAEDARTGQLGMDEMATLRAAGALAYKG
ncbi:MAG: flagellar export protein FliJ [Pedosphaera sp.]|nr:flagellar export protein FliJ [Pedosphaera sp.]